MKSLARLFLLLLPLSGCAPGLEGRPTAVECGFEKLAEVSVTLQRNEPRVTITANDWNLDMVLDTGAENTVITEQASKPLRLRRTGAGSLIQGIGGSQMSWIGLARSVDFGGVRLRDFPFRVAPIQLQRPHGTPPDGLLGADVLIGYDIDLDLPNNRITFYRPRVCADGGPAWDTPFATVPMISADRGRILLPMELDNVQIAAVLDTGAELTTVSRISALRTGRGAAQLESGRRVTITGATDQKITAHQHRFNTLRLGRMLARDPLLIVAALPPGARDAVLGIDFLRGRRVWISYASGRVYFSLPRPAVALIPTGTTTR